MPHKRPGRPPGRPPGSGRPPTLEDLLDLLKKILELLRTPPHFEYAVGPVLPKRRQNMPLDITITNEQKVLVTVSPMTAGGRPAQIDGVPSVSVQTGASTVETTSNPNAFYLISSDNPGDSIFLVQCDADLGEGVQTIADTINLHVSGAAAVNLGLTAAPPELK